MLMTSNPGDGQPPSDPYRQGPAESGPPSYGEPYGQPTEPYGQPTEPPPGYWQQQAQPPGHQPQGSYGDQQPQYGQQPSYGQSYPPYPVAPPNHGGALAAMIVGIVSLVLACGYGIGLLGSPVAWYLGSKSMKEIDFSQGRLGGRGMAQAGKVLGIIGTVLLAFFLVIVVVGGILLFANSGPSGF